MSDLISRQVAIEAIEKYLDKFDCIDANFLDGLKTTKKILNDLPSAQPKQRWIPCSRHLPVVGEYVLATVRLHQKQNTYLNVVYTCFLSRNGSNELYWIREDCHMVFNREDVLAWMPLPDAYKEDD